MGQYYSYEEAPAPIVASSPPPRSSPRVYAKAAASPPKSSPKTKSNSSSRSSKAASAMKKRKLQAPVNPSPVKKGRGRSNSTRSPIRTKSQISSTPMMSPPTQPKLLVSRRSSLPKPPPKPVFKNSMSSSSSSSSSSDGASDADSVVPFSVSDLSDSKVVYLRDLCSEFDVKKYGRKFEVIGRLLPYHPKQTAQDFAAYSDKNIKDMCTGASLPSVGAKKRLIASLVKISGSSADDMEEEEESVELAPLKKVRSKAKASTPQPRRNRRASMRIVPQTEVKRRYTRSKNV